MDHHIITLCLMKNRHLLHVWAVMLRPIWLANLLTVLVLTQVRLNHLRFPFTLHLLFLTSRLLHSLLSRWSTNRHPSLNAIVIWTGTFIIRILSYYWSHVAVWTFMEHLSLLFLMLLSWILLLLRKIIYLPVSLHVKYFALLRLGMNHLNVLTSQKLNCVSWSRGNFILRLRPHVISMKSLRWLQRVFSSLWVECRHWKCALMVLLLLLRR